MKDSKIQSVKSAKTGKKAAVSSTSTLVNRTTGPGLAQLPPELLARVFSFLTSDSAGCKALLSMSLVCRYFVEAARRVIYDSPLRFAALLKLGKIDARCLALLSQLERGHGKLVTDLGHLHIWAALLQKYGPGPNHRSVWFSMSKQSIETSWSIAMIKACPNVRHVGIPLGSFKDFEDDFVIRPQIHSILLRCQRLKAVSTELQAQDYELEHAIHKLLAVVSTMIVESVCISLVTSYDESKCADPRYVPVPYVAPRLRALHLKNSISEVDFKGNGWETLLEYLPSISHAPSLRSITLELFFFYFDGYGNFEGWFVKALKPFGPQLIELDLHDLSAADDILDRFTYARSGGDQGTVFPLGLTSCFPQLTRLSLRGFRGLSILMLRSFATHSPHLCSVVFHNSIWEERAFYRCQKELKSIIRLMSKLTFIELGIVEPNYEHGLNSLKQVCIFRGLELVFTLSKDDYDSDYDDEDLGEIESGGNDSCS